MENATKALLIAAGVLIVILLIAFGMSIFNSTGDTSGQVADASSSQQMQTFNAQFQSYVDRTISGSVLRNLLVTVNTSNSRNPQHPVTVAGTDIVDTSGGYTTTAGNNRTYVITATYGADGYLATIAVN